MGEAEHILTSIIRWATREEPIRAVILEGSRASQALFDELADFDVSVFTRTHEPYTQDDRWISTIGDVWVYISDKYDWGSETIPTRLVIFKDGIKVDFSFVGVHKLAELANTGEPNSGYEVLLDKDGCTDQLPKPVFRRRPNTPPTEKDFLGLVNEFWFEAYHVAKYLKREELWVVKSRDWTTKELLLKMIEWHAQAKHQWDYDTEYMGKHMKSWADESVWQALYRIFARFDRDDSWNGLLASVDLFRQLATEVAERLGFVYPGEVDRNIVGFMRKIKG